MNGWLPLICKHCGTDGWFRLIDLIAHEACCLYRR